MPQAKELLIGFDSLVKNRLGPYHIVLKNEKNEYICAGWRSFQRENAYRYEMDKISSCFLFNNQKVFKERGEKTFPFLSTAGGDIELTRKHFNAKVLFLS